MATIAAAMKLEDRYFMVHEGGEREGLALMPAGIEAQASIPADV
ncbi:hypothetical protein [Sorangium sp. So ce854]